MSDLTPEQRSAQRKLQEAIEEQVAQYRDDDRGVVTDWVVVMATEGYSSEGNAQSAYYLAFANGEMAEHRAVGLLEWGVHMLKNQDLSSE